MSNWKSKLDSLNHKLKLARNLQVHVDRISEKPPELEKPKETTKAVDISALERKIIREKSFISAISRIPAYKSAEFYQLELLNKNTADKPSLGLIHQSSLKLAKRRLSQVVQRLIRDIHGAK